MKKPDLEDMRDQAALSYYIVVHKIEDISNEYEIDKAASNDLLKHVNRALHDRTEYFLELERRNRGPRYWWRSLVRFYTFLFFPEKPIK